MANYKKYFDLEYADLFMEKCGQVSRNMAKSRKYNKRQASKATRRAIKKQTEIEVPVCKYVTKFEGYSYIDGCLGHAEVHETYCEEEIQSRLAVLEHLFSWCDFAVKTTIINL